MMHEVLGDLVGTSCLVYLDDILVWGDTPQEVLTPMRRVMDQLADAGIILNGAKCCFFASEIELLGHHIEKGFVRPQIQKLA